MLEPGQRIDRYVVGRLLGRGGFAEVWAVEHAVLGTPRAVKVLWADKAIVQESLVEEGRVQARLSHPNILPVLDVFVHQDSPVLVMPLVEDATLDHVLAQGGLDPAAVADLMRGLVDAVEFAHAQGVAHRDLKPANVLLELRHGAVVPRVADFGLAKLLDVPANPATGPTPFVGTPAYSAPEQIENARGVDHRADYWSLGVILYELLTGWRPFEVTTLHDLHRRQLERHYTRIRQRDAHLDARWEALTDALLDPDPQRRLSDPGRIRAALDALSPRTEPGPLDADGALASLLWTLGQQTHRGPMITEDLSDGRLANMPVATDAFIGRTQEIDQALALLRHPGLVTITGPAGVGKSRLAVEACRERLRGEAGEALRVDLADARDLDGALIAVASALEVPVVVDDPVLHLAWVIEARGPMLLLLDNVDHVVGPVSDLVTSWTVSDDDLRVLVTGRQPLDLPTERVLRLDVLPNPADESVAAVETNDAVRLFVDRVRKHRPGVSINAGNAAALAQLIRRLDGLPLAIEVAAARPETREVGPVDLSGMLRKLARELDLLGLSSKTDDHERTALRAALDGAWAQLDAEERHLLACMSVFEGGATLAAIRSVAGSIDGKRTEDRLATLVDRSLVRRLPGTGGTPRFGLLRSVHTYGRDRLAELPKPVVRTIERGHAAFFARYGSPHELAALRVRGGTARRASLEIELDNLLVALRRAIGWRDTDAVAALALAAWAITEHTGPYQAAVRWLRDARRAGSGPREADLCLAEGDALRLSGQRDASNRSYEAGLRQARATADPWATALCLDRLGRNCMAQGRLDEADPLLDEAFAEIERSGDVSRVAEIIDDMGWLRLQQRRSQEAEGLFAQALNLFERLGDRGSEAICTQHLALAALARGDLARSDELLQVALQMHRSSGQIRFEGFCLSDLGEIAARDERWDDAAALQRAAVSKQRESGDRHGEALALFRLGKAEQTLEPSDARATLEAAWELANTAGDGPLEAAIEAALRAV